MNGNKPVADLLRFAMGIAAKLDLPEVQNWILYELNGYPDDEELPEYRILAGSFEARNPMRGWIPVTNGSRQFRLSAARISEIEVLSKEPFNYLVPPKPMKLSAGDKYANSLVNTLPQRVEVAGVKFKAILDAVTTRLLQWALALEKNGILGEGMTFNPTEKKAAMSNINITNFHGVLGDVTNSTVNISDFSQIYQKLEQSTLPEAAKAELKEIMLALKDATPEARPPLLERAAKTVETYGPAAGTIVTWLTQIFGG